MLRYRKYDKILRGFCFSFILLASSIVIAEGQARVLYPAAKTTVLCYMNGDNDLASEVFHAIDTMETVGSSDQINVIVLADGHPDWLKTYGREWQRTRLVRIARDPQFGRIRSPVIEEWQEADLGDPSTLQRFVKTAIERFPAEKYIFLMFAHGRGIINTKQFGSVTPNKRLSISRDATSRSAMSMAQMQNALTRALNGQQFELTVLSSCLSNMVEIGYELADVTRYLIASQDEIHLLDEPPGTFQIRGIKFDKIIQHLHDDPSIDIQSLCRIIIDDFMADYRFERHSSLKAAADGSGVFPATMAAIDCRQIASLTTQLDRLAARIIERLEQPAFLKNWQTILGQTQRFPSFLNLEYYDLGNLLEITMLETSDAQIRQLCEEILSQLHSRLIVHEEHTAGQNASGVSIYVSNPLVPQNIFDVHQSLYGQCKFSQDTRWDEMINRYRHRIDDLRPDKNSESQKGDSLLPQPEKRDSRSAR